MDMTPRKMRIAAWFTCILIIILALLAILSIASSLLKEHKSPQARAELEFMKECIEKNTNRRCNELWYWRNR